MVKAKKSLGQNFLIDESILGEIIEAGELTENDLVVEIGPGKAALTEALLDHAGKVIAIELDDRLIPMLSIQFENRNFELIHGDALKYNPPNASYKLIANIPYYISSPLLNHFLLEQFESGNPPEIIVFMLQKEVAEKIVAKDGKFSVLALQVYLFGEPELVCAIPPTAFKPSPKVDSAILKIRVHKEPKIKGNLKELFWLFNMSFAQKRKKLTNNLANAYKKNPAEIRELLEKLQINPDVRAENLSIREWEKLFNELNSGPHPF